VRVVGKSPARTEPSLAGTPSPKASEQDNPLRGTDGTRTCGLRAAGAASLPDTLAATEGKLGFPDAGRMSPALE
jgi:hypothetical protein